MCFNVKWKRYLPEFDSPPGLRGSCLSPSCSRMISEDWVGDYCESRPQLLWRDGVEVWEQILDSEIEPNPAERSHTCNTHNPHRKWSDQWNIRIQEAYRDALQGARIQSLITSHVRGSTGGTSGRVNSRWPPLSACKLFSSADHQHSFLSYEERLWSRQRNGDNSNDGRSSIYCRLIKCQALFLMLDMYSTFPLNNPMKQILY